MKLLRFGSAGQERPGVVGSDGVIRDLSGRLPDLTPEQLSPDALRRLSGLDCTTLPAVRPVPQEPVLFTKAISCLNGPNDDVRLPRGSVKSDWEVELGVVIGTRARYVEEADALKHVAGYCVVNDVSEREYQFERGGTSDKGKGCDTFGPVGPWLIRRICGYGSI
jgi:2,4-diketo-3-deoxy-L-fuconate hydrolase